jgi:hypothetical protein
MPLRPSFHSLICNRFCGDRKRRSRIASRRIYRLHFVGVTHLPPRAVPYRATRRAQGVNLGEVHES